MYCGCSIQRSILIPQQEVDICNFIITILYCGSDRLNLNACGPWPSSYYPTPRFHDIYM